MEPFAPDSPDSLTKKSSGTTFMATTHKECGSDLNSLGIEKPALETLLKCQVRVLNLGTKWSRNSKKVSILTGRVLHP
jgi:hypothetical protein